MLQSELRRRLLRIVGVFFLAEGLPVNPALAENQTTVAERRAFVSFLNVLLPKDTYSGSATEFGVDTALWSLAAHDSRFNQLVTTGCRWLNMTGQGNFADLSAADKNTVLEWMSNSDWNQIPRRFYELVRQVATETYYSKPAALAGLPLNTSPQPLGYPPPWQ